MHPQSMSAAEKLCFCQGSVLLCDLEAGREKWQMCRNRLSLLNQHILFEPSEMLLPALRKVLGAGRQEACRFDVRAAGASAFSVLLGLSWYLPLVRQMERCEFKEQKWCCDLVAEQST